jgi:ABC-type nitrate/sulfonate/bicarbonate transport system substrate-binding protein
MNLFAEEKPKESRIFMAALIPALLFAVPLQVYSRCRTYRGGQGVNGRALDKAYLSMWLDFW